MRQSLKKNYTCLRQDFSWLTMLTMSIRWICASTSKIIMRWIHFMCCLLNAPKLRQRRENLVCPYSPLPPPGGGGGGNFRLKEKGWHPWGKTPIRAGTLIFVSALAVSQEERHLNTVRLCLVDWIKLLEDFHAIPAICICKKPCTWGGKKDPNPQ